MKSRKNNLIEVKKHASSGRMPLLVELGHKHLEKECPVGHGSDFVDGAKTFTVPTDLLRVANIPEALIDGIEEITFSYKE